MKTDDKPENTNYRDEGCEFYYSCLDCPYARCLLDEPLIIRLHKERDLEIKRRVREGEKPAELSQSYRLSSRTIYRILSE